MSNATNLEINKESLENNQSPGKSLVPAKESEQVLLRLVSTLQDKFKYLPAVIKQKQNLPATFDDSNLVNASQLLAQKFPNAYSAEIHEKSIRELSIIMLGFVGFILVSFIGWKLSQEINFLNGGGFVYNTGLIGGILMALTFLYSIVKRVKFFKRRISLSHSYYFHILFGGTGALIIMVHSSFDFRSINSSVAIVCMLLIMISGALGRYLYTQFSLLSHRLYLQVKNTEPDLYNRIYAYNCNSAKHINFGLSELAQYCLVQPKNFLEFIIRSFTVFYYGLFTYFASMRNIHKIVKSASVLGDLDKLDVKLIQTIHRKELLTYISRIVKISYLNLLEQLFHHWRILHVPFLYILVITSIVHVVVVHMY